MFSETESTQPFLLEHRKESFAEETSEGLRAIVFAGVPFTRLPSQCARVPLEPLFAFSEKCSLLLPVSPLLFGVLNKAGFTLGRLAGDASIHVRLSSCTQLTFLALCLADASQHFVVL